MVKNTINLIKTIELQKRILGIHYIYMIVYAATLVSYQAWKLITPTALLQRWALLAIIAIGYLLIWFYVNSNKPKKHGFDFIARIIIYLGVVFAAANVYLERGMASKSVLLFTIPIVVSAILLSKAAIYYTAALSALLYALSVITYSIHYPSEGYKIELFGSIGFNAALFFITAFLLVLLTKHKRK